MVSSYGNDIFTRVPEKVMAGTVTNSENGATGSVTRSQANHRIRIDREEAAAAAARTIESIFNTVAPLLSCDQFRKGDGSHPLFIRLLPPPWRIPAGFCRRSGISKGTSKLQYGIYRVRDGDIGSRLALRPRFDGTRGKKEADINKMTLFA